MDDEQASHELAGRLRRRFPDEAARTDQWFKKQGATDRTHSDYDWIEAFAGRVTDAVRKQSSAKVEELTKFFAEQYREGPVAVQRIVDVALAENILFGIDDDVKVWAWPHIATEIRHLYAAMWGVPH
jgi:hypothetical protein